jgi:hypothetical protein
LPFAVIFDPSRAILCPALVIVSPRRSIGGL